MKLKEVNKTDKRDQSSGEIIQSKRAIWNSRRRHNYKYVTSVF